MEWFLVWMTKKTKTTAKQRAVGACKFKDSFLADEGKLE